MLHQNTATIPVIAEEVTRAPELPVKKGIIYRALRHPLLMPYNRLAALGILINLGIFLSSASLSATEISTIILANFAIAIIIRMQDVINILFKIATSTPHSFPLSVRWAAGKVYHFGGIHVGTYFSGTLWLAYLTYMKAIEPSFTAIPLAMLVIHVAILALICFVALPKFRAKYHNTFEIIARFGNWTSLALFWAQTVITIRAASETDFFLQDFLLSPFVWILSILTFVIALPWIRMRKIDIDINTPSNHVALSSFDYGVTPFAGSSTDLSTNPLFEWHSFANIPAPSASGFRLAISRAGDWTGRLIEQKPKQIWVKGIPAAGVGNIELLFKKVVWVATGSGIGPCLPHLLDKKVPAKLVWSTRDPKLTYGEKFTNEILSAQPDAIIWNTQKHGKPDLVKLAYQAAIESGAEAVICISNKKTTWHVNYELESRGIPAFGAIWDS